MTLNAYERENLAALIPPHVGSIDEMILAAKLRKKLSLNDDEKAQIDYKLTELPGGSVPSWDASKAKALVADVDVADDERALLKKGVELLEAEGRIPTSDAFFELYQKLSE